MRSKLSGYAVQYAYLLGNLCVKTDATALLSIEVEIDGQSLNLEDVAISGILDDTRFFFYPNDKELMPHIIEGIKKAHPEFETSTEKLEEAPEDNNEQIIAKMPPVDEDRHKELTDAVKTLSDACKSQMDANAQLYNGRIALALATAGGDEQKEATDAAKEICDWHSDLCKQYKENKESEIEAAYEAWKKEGGDSSNGSGSSSDDAAFNMKMN